MRSYRAIQRRIDEGLKMIDGLTLILVFAIAFRIAGDITAETFGEGNDDAR